MLAPLLARPSPRPCRAQPGPRPTLGVPRPTCPPGSSRAARSTTWRAASTWVGGDARPRAQGAANVGARRPLSASRRTAPRRTCSPTPRTTCTATRCCFSSGTCGPGRASTRWTRPRRRRRDVARALRPRPRVSQRRCARRSRLRSRDEALAEGSASERRGGFFGGRTGEKDELKRKKGGSNARLHGRGRRVRLHEASYDAILDATALATLQPTSSRCPVRGPSTCPCGRTCTLTDGACQLLAIATPSTRRSPGTASSGARRVRLARRARSFARFVVCVCGQYDSHERRRYDIE